MTAAKFIAICGLAMLTGCGGKGTAATETKPTPPAPAKQVNAIALDDALFAQHVTGETNGVAMVDFWSAWCAPCIKMAPDIEALATEFKGQAFVGKVDLDVYENLGTKHNVLALPCLLIFKGGKEIDRREGPATREQLKEFLKRNL